MMNLKLKIHYFEKLAFFLLLIISCNRIIFGPYSLEDQVLLKTHIELIWWSIIFLLFSIVFFIIKEGKITVFNRTNLIILVIFVLYCAISLSWTINIEASIYKVIVLIFSSIIGFQIGSYFNIEKIVNFLFWPLAILSLGCLFLGIFFPEYGINIGFPYFGAWEGVFWSKNYFGPMMALLNIICLFIIYNPNKKQMIKIAGISFYIISGVLVVLSKCATAIISMVIINITFYILLLWLKINKYLSIKRYIAIGILLLIVIIIFLVNINSFLSIFNRNSSLSGRVELWPYLINYSFENNAILGSGFGSFWDSNNIRDSSQDILNFTLTPFIADNGFLDIYLNTGIIGFIIFLGLVIFSIYRSAKFLFISKTIISIFPILLISFILITNITLSFFLEFESLFWLLLIIMLFACSPNNQKLVTPTTQEVLRSN